MVTFPKQAKIYTKTTARGTLKIRAGRGLVSWDADEALFTDATPVLQQLKTSRQKVVYNGRLDSYYSLNEQNGHLQVLSNAQIKQPSSITEGKIFVPLGSFGSPNGNFTPALPVVQPPSMGWRSQLTLPAKPRLPASTIRRRNARRQVEFELLKYKNMFNWVRYYARPGPNFVERVISAVKVGDLALLYRYSLQALWTIGWEFLFYPVRRAARFTLFFSELIFLHGRSSRALIESRYIIWSWLLGRGRGGTDFYKNLSVGLEYTARYLYYYSFRSTRLYLAEMLDTRTSLMIFLPILALGYAATRTFSDLGFSRGYKLTSVHKDWTVRPMTLAEQDVWLNALTNRELRLTKKVKKRNSLRHLLRAEELLILEPKHTGMGQNLFIPQRVLGSSFVTGHKIFEKARGFELGWSTEQKRDELAWSQGQLDLVNPDLYREEVFDESLDNLQAGLFNKEDGLKDASERPLLRAVDGKGEEDDEEYEENEPLEEDDSLRSATRKQTHTSFIGEHIDLEDSESTTEAFDSDPPKIELITSDIGFPCFTADGEVYHTRMLWPISRTSTDLTDVPVQPRKFKPPGKKKKSTNVQQESVSNTNAFEEPISPTHDALALFIDAAEEVESQDTDTEEIVKILPSVKPINRDEVQHSVTIATEEPTRQIFNTYTQTRASTGVLSRKTPGTADKLGVNKWSELPPYSLPNNYALENLLRGESVHELSHAFSQTYIQPQLLKTKSLADDELEYIESTEQRPVAQSEFHPAQEIDEDNETPHYAIDLGGLYTYKDPLLTTAAECVRQGETPRFVSLDDCILRDEPEPSSDTGFEDLDDDDDEIDEIETEEDEDEGNLQFVSNSVSFDRFDELAIEDTDDDLDDIDNLDSTPAQINALDQDLSNNIGDFETPTESQKDFFVSIYDRGPGPGFAFERDPGNQEFSVTSYDRETAMIPKSFLSQITRFTFDARYIVWGWFWLSLHKLVHFRTRGSGARVQRVFRHVGRLPHRRATYDQIVGMRSPKTALYELVIGFQNYRLLTFVRPSQLVHFWEKFILSPLSANARNPLALFMSFWQKKFKNQLVTSALHDFPSFKLLTEDYVGTEFLQFYQAEEARVRKSAHFTRRTRGTKRRFQEPGVSPLGKGVRTLAMLHDQVRTRVIREFAFSAVRATIQPNQIRLDQLPRGLLICGIVGNGQGLIVRAIATEARSRLFRVEGNRFLNPDRGPEWLILLFEFVRRQAPNILHISFFELVAQRRTPDISMAAVRLTNQFLLCLDGFNFGTEPQPSQNRVFVIGSTQSRLSIDPACLRSGRFEWVVEVGFPGKVERIKLLRMYTARTRIPLSSDLNWHYFSLLTEGYTCGQVRAVIASSTVQFINEGYSGHSTPSFLQGIHQMNRLLLAFAEVKPPKPGFWEKASQTQVFVPSFSSKQHGFDQKTDVNTLSLLLGLIFMPTLWGSHPPALKHIYFSTTDQLLPNFVWFMGEVFLFKRAKYLLSQKGLRCMFDTYLDTIGEFATLKVTEVATPYLVDKLLTSPERKLEDCLATWLGGTRPPGTELELENLFEVLDFEDSEPTGPTIFSRTHNLVKWLARRPFQESYYPLATMDMAPDLALSEVPGVYGSVDIFTEWLSLIGYEVGMARANTYLEYPHIRDAYGTRFFRLVARRPIAGPTPLQDPYVFKDQNPFGSFNPSSALSDSISLESEVSLKESGNITGLTLGFDDLGKVGVNFMPRLAKEST